jgi:hypothetical protein
MRLSSVPHPFMSSVFTSVDCSILAKAGVICSIESAKKINLVTSFNNNNIMEDALGLAMEVAQKSTMDKHLGCVIVHRRRVVACSENYTVGTAIKHNKSLYNVSMHSEMGAIELLAKDMGFLQRLHDILSGRRRHCRFEKRKVCPPPDVRRFGCRKGMQTKGHW